MDKVSVGIGGGCTTSWGRGGTKVGAGGAEGTFKTNLSEVSVTCRKESQRT